MKKEFEDSILLFCWITVSAEFARNVKQFIDVDWVSFPDVVSDMAVSIAHEKCKIPDKFHQATMELIKETSTMVANQLIEKAEIL